LKKTDALAHKTTFVIDSIQGYQESAPKANLIETPMSRLTIDVTKEQHQTLKAMAALQGKTIKEYALERLFPSDVDELQAMQELKALLMARLMEAERDGVIDKSATEIAEEEFSKIATA
jgi:hypothetical protein